MNSEKPHLQELANKTVSYRRFGSGKRKILFFHGFPGSSAQIEPLLPFIEAMELEVVCMDRPGYGQTEPHGSRQLESVTKLSRGLTEKFGWKSCELMSVSGGTPFLFSFAKEYPDFVSRINIVSGLGPVGTSQFRNFLDPKAKIALRLLPLLPGWLLRQIPGAASDEKKTSRSSVIGFFLPSSSEDIRVLENSVSLKTLQKSLQEAFQQDGLGPKNDSKAFLSDWNLELPKFKGTIDIWHGGQDRILPVSMAHSMAKNLKNSRLHISPEEGHFSLAFKRISQILEQK